MSLQTQPGSYRPPSRQVTPLLSSGVGRGPPRPLRASCYLLLGLWASTGLLTPELMSKGPEAVLPSQHLGAGPNSLEQPRATRGPSRAGMGTGLATSFA